MAAGRRYLNLNVYLRNSGYHEAAWRVSAADPASVLDPRHYVGLAATAERGVLDSIFLPDSPGVAHFRSEYLPGAGLDPLQLLSAVATGTEQIGLIATVSTTYSYPWDVARRLATLDFISHGRAGWNIVTTAEPAAAGNFGDQPHPPAADRYERAGEFVDVVLKLWDAWEDGAAVMARDTGQWADLARLHPPAAPRPVLRRGRLSPVPPLAAGPPVPDPGRHVGRRESACRRGTPTRSSPRWPTSPPGWRSGTTCARRPRRAAGSRGTSGSCRGCRSCSRAVTPRLPR